MAIILAGGLVVGLLLGLLGSGGSIATVPILVYLLGQNEKVAIAGSLAIVGGIALTGAVRYGRRRLIDWRSVLLFGGPGMVGAYAGAALSRYVSGNTQLAVFALVMFVAAWFMLRPPKLMPDGRRHAGKIVLDGLAVGALTGFVGVGGGFLIVPALVLLGGLRPHLAIGTSLMIIALKSAAGFAKYVSVLADQGLHIDWAVVGTFIAAGTVGTFAGGAVAHRLHQDTLRRAFGYFVVLMAAVILFTRT